MVDTENNDPKNADFSSNESLPDTREKLKPCLELLFGSINLGLSVIGEIVVRLLAKNNPETHIFSWLLKSKKLSTVYMGDG